MARTQFETDRLLVWLGEVLRRSEAVDLDIVVVDRPSEGSALQIIVSNLPGPLAGLAVKPTGDAAPAGRAR